MSNATKTLGLLLLTIGLWGCQNVTPTGFTSARDVERPGLVTGKKGHFVLFGEEADKKSSETQEEDIK